MLSYIALGSNLGDPLEQVRTALKALTRLPLSSVVGRSSLYLSQPMGPQNQPSYINAVVALETSISAVRLLRALQQVEDEQGRIRGSQRWGPRTLDLDILLYNGLVIEHPILNLPHLGLRMRPFVLYPLFELAPELVLPDGNSLKSLLKTVHPEGLQRLSEDL